MLLLQQKNTILMATLFYNRLFGCSRWTSPGIERAWKEGIWVVPLGGSTQVALLSCLME